jgi:uncharacterized protein YeeX (DUF496 family)
MSLFSRRELPVEELRARLAEVLEACRRQRVTLLLEREQVSLCRDLRHAKARVQLRKTFREEMEKEIEATVRPLVESAFTG